MMHQPPLKLATCFFSDLHIRENTPFNPSDDYWTSPTPEEEVEFRVRVFHDESEGPRKQWRAGLQIETSSHDEDSSPTSPYTIQVTAIGEFVVTDSDRTEEDIEALVAKVGGAMLYSAAREFLATVSARMIHGTYLLPTVSFVNMTRNATSAEN